MGSRVPARPPTGHGLHHVSLKWLGLAVGGALLVGSAPTPVPSPAGLLPVPAPSATERPPTVRAGYTMVSGTAPLRERPEQQAEWDRGYHPDISSDGAARNGEGVSTIGGSSHITTAPAGLLPGGLALSAPVDSTRITSRFGWRLNPTGPGAYIHIGQDYGVPCGSPVRAAEDGTVVQSAWAGHSGQRVRVDHGSGVETAYSHNSLLVVHVGDTVRQGDLLALSGTTGNSTGCHVHFEVYLNGKWVDPARYLPLLPGQKRPVTPDERREIEDHRASPPPADRTTTAAHPVQATTAPTDPSERSEPSGASGADRKEPASSAPRAPAPAPSPRPDPTPEASHPAPARTAAPTATARPEEPTRAATPSPAPSPTASPSPSAEPTTSPAATPTPSASPADPTPSATTPSSTGTPPGDEPTASPSPTPEPTPSPTPEPTPTQAPGPKPDPVEPTPASPPPTTPPADVPPTLAALCQAYLDENAAPTADAKAPASRNLGRAEVTLLAQALEATLPTARPLPEQPTVAQVADRCPAWFPHGIAEDTVPADLAALSRAVVPGTRSGGGTRK